VTVESSCAAGDFAGQPLGSANPDVTKGKAMLRFATNPPEKIAIGAGAATVRILTQAAGGRNQPSSKAQL
jgi:hypothetical protein